MAIETGEIVLKKVISEERSVKKLAYTFSFVLIFAVGAVIFAASFQVYPGAKLVDVYEMKQPETLGKAPKSSKEIVFTTNDPFESVVAFYRGIAREYRTPGGGKPVTLPSGQELKEAYFIFDSAGDLGTSNHWVKIQRPYLGKGQPAEKYGAAREVTAIIEEDKRSYP